MILRDVAGSLAPLVRNDCSEFGSLITENNFYHEEDSGMQDEGLSGEHSRKNYKNICQNI